MPPPISGLERPQQAVSSLLSGDVEGAWQSMLAPQTLTPRERDQLLGKLGVTGTVYENVFQAVTNPILILSLIVSHKFPVPVGDALFKLSRQVSGMASRLPILRSLASPQAIFRGQPIWDDMVKVAADVMDFKKRYGEEAAVALTKFQKATGRLPSSREQVMVSAWLDGLHKNLRGWGKAGEKLRIGSGETTATLKGVGALFPGLEGKMGRPLLGLAQDLKARFERQRIEIFEKPENRRNLVRVILKLTKQGLIDDDMAQFIRDPGKIVDYFPHRSIQTDEDFRRLIAVMTQSGSRRFAKAAENKATQWISPEVMERKWAMIPDRQDLKSVQDLMDPEAWTRLQRGLKARVFNAARTAGISMNSIRKMDALPIDEVMEKYPTLMQPAEAEHMAGALLAAMPRQYSLKLMPVLNSYDHTLAGTYAWTVRGGGIKMQGHINEARAFAQAGDARAKWRSGYLENTLLPQMMGRGTFRQAIRAQMWDQGMARTAAALDSPAISKVLGEKLTGSLKEHLKNSHGAFNFNAMQARASGYFYLSTLGLNVGSALTNLLQNVLTTGPTLGFRTAAAGASAAMQKSHKYFALRLGGRAISHEAALLKAFPEFGQAGLVSAPITEEVIAHTLQNAYNVSRLPGAVVKTSEKISRAMMSLFTASETANRLIAFESGMIHARRAKMPIDSAIQFSRKVVDVTQFPAGVHNTPAILANLPPLARQFLGFPVKMLEFATSTAMTLGSEGKNVFGYNPGTFARMIAGSVIAMELGDTMGLDLRNALFTGAIPLPEKTGRPFSPLPVVPPFFQITGAAATGLVSGDFSDLARSTPLLIPGGIQAFKLAGLMPGPLSEPGQAFARGFERTYVDYNQPSPDGRYAVYSGQGTFRGFYNSWDLVKFGFGVRGGDLDKETNLLETITRGRDEIVQSKRDYLDALFRNDPRTANRTAQGFEKKFGFKIPVSQNDVKVMQTRRTVTRLEQLIRTTPPGEARNQLISLVQVTLGSTAAETLGVDPTMFGQTRPQAEKSRQAYRRTFPNNRFNPHTDLGPQDEVNPQKIGRQPGVTNAGPPF